MRKLYLIRENEEDGRLLDALIAAGHSLDDAEFENPVCPVCGSCTLPAYTENGEFEVITWYHLDENEGEAADAWFLVCGNMECTWEEEVERVKDPMGATIFDLDIAHHEFDEYSGLLSRDPPEMLTLIEWLKSNLEHGPNRKLLCFLVEAEWQYEEHLKRTRKWIDRVPAGKQVRFTLECEEFEGTFITATEQGFMAFLEPNGEFKHVRTEDVYACQPLRPDRDDLSRRTHEPFRRMDPQKDLIVINGAVEFVVIRGHHLQLSIIDKFGQYHVRCWSAAAAKDLNLNEKCENYWEGTFRKTDVESRYDLRHMVKVKGYWLDVWGKSGQDCPAVRTNDPQIASELGLKPDPNWNRNDEDDAPPRPHRPSWSGVIPDADVEERKEVRLYHWPLPEFPLPDGR